MQRLYTRYVFSAAVEIVDSSGIEMRARVTNISFGGCRLVAHRGLPVGMAITLRIHGSDVFEATAIIMHSSTNEMGIMFHDVSSTSLLILRNWIDVAKSASLNAS